MAEPGTAADRRAAILGAATHGAAAPGVAAAVPGVVARGAAGEGAPWGGGGGSWGGGGWGGGGWGYYGPVVLDMTGGGIKITPLSQSNTFFDMTGDGYKNRSAWAGAGNAVLFFDPNGTNQITQADQIIFTKWDPSAKTDTQALLDVFDTNHNGQLDSGDTKFAQFKLMVTNANGTTSVETLAQGGVASINLTANNVSQTFSDGSSIDGEMTYTKTGGGTGTAATVTLATDPNGHVVQSTTGVNLSTGEVTVDSKALNTDGSLASEITTVTSSDGLNRTMRTDVDGDGVVDLIQTDTTVVSGATTTETLTDTTKAGVLLDQTVTTTVVSGGTTTKTINRDANGSMVSGVAVVSQREVDTTTGGLTTISVTDLNPDGSTRDRIVTTPSAAGMTNTVQRDFNGDNVFDLTTVTTTTVDGATGARTTTVTESNANGSRKDQTVTITSANGQTSSQTSDVDGDSLIDLTVATTIVPNTTSPAFFNGTAGTLTQVIQTARNGAFVGESMSFVSNDGLLKATYFDTTGAGTAAAPVNNGLAIDMTVVDADGSRTETVTDRNGDGSLKDQTVTTKGVDGITRTTQVDSTGATAANGGSIFDMVETVAKDGSGQTVNTVSRYAQNGALIARTVTTTSANGLTSTVTSDADGNGTVDLTTVTTTAATGSGGSTVTRTDKSANNTTLDTIVTTTSADGLTVTTQSTIGATSTTKTDATVANQNGSITETVSVTSSGGTLESKVTTDTSSDRNTQTITSDLNGDGVTDRIETIVKQSNGSIVDTVSVYGGSSLSSQTVTTTSASGLSKTTTVNVDGKVDTTTTDVVALNADGSRTETVSVYANNSTLESQVITTTSANGLSSVTTSNTDGKIDSTTSDVTTINADASRTETVLVKNSNGIVVHGATTTTSANGLSVVTQNDLNGDGTPDQTHSDVTVVNAYRRRIVEGYKTRYRRRQFVRLYRHDDHFTGRDRNRNIGKKECCGDFDHEGFSKDECRRPKSMA